MKLAYQNRDLDSNNSKIVGRRSEAPSAIFCDVPLTVPARIKMADGATLIRPTNPNAF